MERAASASVSAWVCCRPAACRRLLPPACRLPVPAFHACQPPMSFAPALPHRVHIQVGQSQQRTKMEAGSGSGMGRKLVKCCGGRRRWCFSQAGRSGVVVVHAKKPSALESGEAASGEQREASGERREASSSQAVACVAAGACAAHMHCTSCSRMSAGNGKPCRLACQHVRDERGFRCVDVHPHRAQLGLHHRRALGVLNLGLGGGRTSMPRG